MGASICCAIPRDAARYAEAAAHWMQAFHPAIVATIDGDMVLLASDLHQSDWLEAAWASALANERVVHEAASARAATLARLLG